MRRPAGHIILLYRDKDLIVYKTAAAEKSGDTQRTGTTRKNVTTFLKHKVI